jgi:hypothetical protein
MGRTLPSITIAFLQEQESFSRFRRALRRGDQQVLDGLFAAAHRHLAAAAYASHPLPFEVFLLAMLLEEHKEVLRLSRLLGVDTYPQAAQTPAYLDEDGADWLAA